MLYFTSLAHPSNLNRAGKNVTRVGKKVGGPLERKRSSLHSLAPTAISSPPAARHKISHINNTDKTEYFFLCTKEPRLFKTVFPL